MFKFYIRLYVISFNLSFRSKKYKVNAKYENIISSLFFKVDLTHIYKHNVLLQ